MKTYIVLLRGINVGGRNILPMKALRALLKDLGADNVKTYIQSGNVIMQHPAEDEDQLAADIRTAIQTQHGFEPRVLLLDSSDMVEAAAANPFPEGEGEPKSLHLYFLTAIPSNPDWQLLEGVKKDSERYKLLGRVFYLHAPEGIGRSKLAERVERALGVPATARNWRTVSKLLAMVQPD